MKQANTKISKIVTLVVAFLAISGLSALAGEGPIYSDGRTESTIQKMVDAHGGLSAWKMAPSMSFDNVMYIGPDAFPLQDGMSKWFVWDVSRETVDFKNHRAYKNILPDKGEIRTNNEIIWTNDLDLNNIDAGVPTRFRIWHHCSFINLPWLTQQDGINLRELDPAKLPGDETNYKVVEMKFGQSDQRLEDEYLKLYIDPETNLLKASEYRLVFSAVNDGMALPEGAALGLPPMLRINDEFVTADGLTVPSRYTTFNKTGEMLFGYHLIMNVSFSEPFDESQLDSAPSDEMGMKN